MAENRSFEVKQKIPKYATILTKLQTHVATTLVHDSVKKKKNYITMTKLLVIYLLKLSKGGLC